MRAAAELPPLGWMDAQWGETVDALVEGMARLLVRLDAGLALHARKALVLFLAASICL